MMIIAYQHSKGMKVQLTKYRKQICEMYLGYEASNDVDLLKQCHTSAPCNQRIGPNWWMTYRATSQHCSARLGSVRINAIHLCSQPVCYAAHHQPIPTSMWSNFVRNYNAKIAFRCAVPDSNPIYRGDTSLPRTIYNNITAHFGTHHNKIQCR